MSALATAVLASHVLDQNPGVVRQKKFKTVGFATPFRLQHGMGNTTEINNMDLDDNIPVSVNSSSQKLAKGKTAEINNMDLDDNNPVTFNSSDDESMIVGDDSDEAYGQSKLDRSGRIAPCVEYSESFQYITHISQVYQNHYIDHAGPSRLTHDDSLLQDPHEDVDMDQDYPAALSPHQTPSPHQTLSPHHPAPPHHPASSRRHPAQSILPDDDVGHHPAQSPLPDDDIGMGENLNEVYGLSNLRRSRRIADGVRKIGLQRWGLNASVNFVNDREESDEEEEDDIEDDESNDDLDVAGDEGLEGDEDDEDEDELFAGSGQEGISLWDRLGEGFLKEASQLGIYVILVLLF